MKVKKEEAMPESESRTVNDPVASNGKDKSEAWHWIEKRKSRRGITEKKIKNKVQRVWAMDIRTNKAKMTLQAV